jgi:hypothetical protein
MEKLQVVKYLSIELLLLFPFPLEGKGLAKQES